MQGQSPYSGQAINTFTVVLRFTFISLLLSSTSFVASSAKSHHGVIRYGGHRHAVAATYKHRHGPYRWREIHTNERVVEAVLLPNEEYEQVGDIASHEGDRLSRRTPKGDQPQGKNGKDNGKDTSAETSDSTPTPTSSNEEDQGSTPKPSPSSKPKHPDEPGCYSLSDPHCPDNDKCCPDTNPICASWSDGTYECIPDPKAKTTSSQSAPKTIQTTTSHATTSTPTTSISSTTIAQVTSSSVINAAITPTTTQATTVEHSIVASTTSSVSKATQTSTESAYDKFNKSKTPMISGIVAGSIVAVVLGVLFIRVIVNKRRERRGMNRIPSPQLPQNKEETGISPLAPAVLAGVAGTRTENRGRDKELKQYTGGHDAAGPQYRYATDGQPLTPPSPPPSSSMFQQYRGSPTYGSGTGSPSTQTSPSPLNTGQNHNLYGQGMYDEDAQTFNDNHGVQSHTSQVNYTYAPMPAEPARSQTSTPNPGVQSHTSQVNYMYAPMPAEPARGQTSSPNPGVMRMPTVLRVRETKGREGGGPTSPISPGGRTQGQGDEMFYGGAGI